MGDGAFGKEIHPDTLSVSPSSALALSLYSRCFLSAQTKEEGGITHIPAERHSKPEREEGGGVAGGAYS